MAYSEKLAQNYYESRDKFNETDNELLDILRVNGIEGADVLDLGSGDGRYAKLIKEMGAKSVTGVDNSSAMIELSQKQNTDNDPGLNFVQAEGDELPFTDAKFDVIFSNYVMHYFKDSAKAFSEISRVLKNDGYFAGTFNVTDVASGSEHLNNTNMPVRLGQGDKFVIVQNLIKSPEDIQAALKTAGLEVVSSKELDTPNAVVDDGFKDKDHINKRAMLFVLKKTAVNHE